MERWKGTVSPHRGWRRPLAILRRYIAWSAERSSAWQLVDVVEEAEHALLKHSGGTFVIVGQAVVSEQMPIAGV